MILPADAAQNPPGFDALFAGLHGGAVDEDVRAQVAPFIAQYLPAMTVTADMLVLHFLGDEALHAGSARPPAAFYLRCVAIALATADVRRVLLVFPDRSNPCVTAVEMALRARAIPVSCWCGDAHGVAAAMLAATHLATPSAPLSIGVAHMSDGLRTLLTTQYGTALRAAATTRRIAVFVGTHRTAVPAAWGESLAQRTDLLACAETDIIIADLAAILAVQPEDLGRDMAMLAAADGPARLAADLALRFPDDPALPVLRALLVAILDPDAPMPSLPWAEGEDALALGNIAHIRALRRGTVNHEPVSFGHEYDFLPETHIIAAWSLLFRVNLLAMRQIRPTRKIAAVVAVRDEGINLIEWVAHHQAIGVERIFIYSNDNIDGSDALLASLAEHGLITLLSHTSALGINVQRKALQHAVHFLPELRDFEWVLFVDADEFTIPAERHDHCLAGLIAAAETTASVGAVLLPWQWRLWPHRFDRQSGMLLSLFPHAVPHFLFKSMVRLQDALGMCSVHAPTLDDGKIVIDSGLMEVSPDQLWGPSIKSSDNGWIEHFWARSFVEFVVKRQRAAALKIPTIDFNRDTALFQTWNAPMTLQNLRPVPTTIVVRTRAAMERMLALPEIALAAAEVEARFTIRAAAIAADPAMSAAFAGLSDPNPFQPWTADNVGRCQATLAGPDGSARLAAVFARHFADAPAYGILCRLLDAICDPEASLPVVETDNPQALIWLDAIARSRAQRLGQPGRGMIELGLDHDFLAEHGGLPIWTVWQWLGVLALRQIPPSQTVAAMVSTRNEGINLLEWVAHYQAIGVERIFVYTNDNNDGSDALLAALSEHDIITLVVQRCGTGVWAQRRALQHALLMLPELRHFAWVLFPDADEYTVPDARYDHQIAPLLAAADALASRPGAILLPWRMRLWPHRFSRPPGMTLANYPHAVVHELFKAAVRPSVATSMMEIHFPNLDPGVTLVDSNLAELPGDARWSSEPKSDAGGRIEHVWARSFTDFVIKRARGFTGGVRHIDLFHQFNRPATPENLWPVEPVVIARIEEKLAALRAIPEIATAADQIDAIYVARAAEIAADPELRAIFDAMPNPNGEQPG